MRQLEEEREKSFDVPTPKNDIKLEELQAKDTKIAQLESELVYFIYLFASVF